MVGRLRRKRTRTFVGGLLALGLALSAWLAYSMATPAGGVYGLPALSIGDQSVIQPSTGKVKMTFTVTLSTPSSAKVSVKFATADGTATSPQDYLAKKGVLSFAHGQTSKTITITVKGNPIGQPNKTFSVVLSDPKNAVIADGTATGIIINNQPPGISIDDPSLLEPGGTARMTFTVSLTVARATTVKVMFATQDVTATTPEDYRKDTGTLTFRPGQTFKTIPVVVKNDHVVGPDETFIVGLSAPTNAILVKSVGIGTIRDNGAP